MANLLDNQSLNTEEILDDVIALAATSQSHPIVCQTFGDLIAMNAAGYVLEANAKCCLTIAVGAMPVNFDFLLERVFRPTIKLPGSKLFIQTVGSVKRNLKEKMLKALQ
ncbi:hypothetical protein [Martelella sp. FOR1707]